MTATQTAEAVSADRLARYKELVAKHAETPGASHVNWPWPSTDAEADELIAEVLEAIGDALACPRCVGEAELNGRDGGESIDWRAIDAWRSSTPHTCADGEFGDLPYEDRTA